MAYTRLVQLSQQPLSDSGGSDHTVCITAIRCIFSTVLSFYSHGFYCVVQLNSFTTIKRHVPTRFNLNVKCDGYCQVFMSVLFIYFYDVYLVIYVNISIFCAED